MLLAKYVAIYRIMGLSALTPDEDADFPVRTGLTFKLTTDPEPFAPTADLRTAVVHAALNAVFGGGERHGSPEEQIEEARKVEVEARKKRAGKGVFLIVLASDDQLQPDLETVRDVGDFQIAFDAMPKGHFTQLLAREFDSFLSSLSLVMPLDVSRAAEKITEAAFLEDTVTGKNTYSLAFSASGRASLARSFSAEQVNEVAAVFKALTEDEGLRTPIRLLSQSLRTNENDPRAFLSAWAALEIFVNKAFAQYHAAWELALRRGAPAVGQRYFDSVARIMAGKFNLVDKFAVIAAILDPQEGSSDATKLLEAKKARDEFYHAVGEEPGRQVSLELLGKYVRLHLDRSVSIAPQASNQ